MKKIYVILLVSVIGAAFVIIPPTLDLLAVNDVTFLGVTVFPLASADAVPVNFNVYVDSVSNPGMQVSLIDVNSNYINITFDNASYIVLDVSSGYFKAPALPAGVTLTETACLGNKMTLTGDALAVGSVVKVEVTKERPACVPATRSGGDSLSTVPENVLVKVNNGAACTETQDVFVNLEAKNASSVLVSNNSEFIDSEWVDFLSPADMTWQLSEGAGKKNVYVLFKTAVGSYSNEYIATIEYKPEGCGDLDTIGDVGEITDGETTDNVDQGQQIDELTPGMIVKGFSSVVYYIDSNSMRHVFPTQGTYSTWYGDFSNVKTISDQELATYSLGKNVTYKPGVKMLKIKYTPKVYAVDKKGVLRWIVSEELAKELYGSNWQFLVEDLGDVFFVDYSIGEAIDDVNDYNPQSITSSVTSIDSEL